MIRDDDTFYSCTITDVDEHGIATVERANFRDALFPVSMFFLYEHNGWYYYPLTMEFRLIDNNLLYLIDELQLDSMDEIFRVLTSSMNKEELWSNQFEVAIIHLKHPPHFCHLLRESFTVETVARHVYE
jgi:hypothetical protein